MNLEYEKPQETTGDKVQQDKIFTDVITMGTGVLSFTVNRAFVPPDTGEGTSPSVWWCETVHQPKPTFPRRDTVFHRGGHGTVLRTGLVTFPNCTRAPTPSGLPVWCSGGTRT